MEHPHNIAPWPLSYRQLISISFFLSPILQPAPPFLAIPTQWHFSFLPTTNLLPLSNLRTHWHFTFRLQPFFQPAPTLLPLSSQLAFQFPHSTSHQLSSPFNPPGISPSTLFRSATIFPYIPIHSVQITETICSELLPSAGVCEVC